MDLAARVAHELALFAATGFLIGGLDDLAIDLIWAVRALWRDRTVYRHHSRANAATLGRAIPGRLAIFVPAWREEAVIGAMIATARARLGSRDWRLYVGCYPNDPGTILAADRAGRADPRIRLVVGDAPGPTTKAGCLNWLWQAMLADEAAERRYVKAVILHDAEDMVHRDELAVYDTLIDRFDMVQLPVEPAAVMGAGWWRRFVSTHYAGEFAEAHRKQIVVREAIGAAVPSAGVGCAIGRQALARAARQRAGSDAGPFDPSTLTEDYELGLRIGMAGGRGAFVTLPAADGDGLVAVRACFPATLSTAIRQKSRWVAGIALAGWDRLGWQGGIAERWMRLRDRRAPLAALVMMTGYAAAMLWLCATLLGDTPWPAPPGWLLAIDLALLGWRMVVRTGFTAAVHGWRLALLTPLHMVIGNVVAIGAAVRAIGLYTGMARTGRLRWDKTAHVFPATP